MKLFEKYTLDHYASDKEIINDFHLGSAFILEEMNRYRDQYRIHFQYKEQLYSIVLTPQIQTKMNEIYFFEDTDILHPLIQVFILRNDLQKCRECLLKYQMNLLFLFSFDFIYSFEEDITKSFLEWLMHISNLLFVKMIHYHRKMKELPLNQFQFYENLDKEHFDIEYYMHKMSVTYETARHHLNQGVKMGFYSRHKIGKKYVYMKEIYDTDRLFSTESGSY